MKLYYIICLFSLNIQYRHIVTQLRPVDGTTGEPVYMNVSKPQRNPDIQMSSSHQEAYVAMGLPYFK